MTTMSTLTQNSLDEALQKIWAETSRAILELREEMKTDVRNMEQSIAASVVAATKQKSNQHGSRIDYRRRIHRSSIKWYDRNNEIGNGQIRFFNTNSNFAGQQSKNTCRQPREHSEQKIEISRTISSTTQRRQQSWITKSAGETATPDLNSTINSAFLWEPWTTRVPGGKLMLSSDDQHLVNETNVRQHYRRVKIQLGRKMRKTKNLKHKNHNNTNQATL
jgi:hypothetical protein